MRINKPLAALADTVLVIVFATFGRGAHAEGVGPAEVAQTAWPFLVGLAAGWAVLLVTARPHTAVRTGVLLWLTTFVGGMTCRGVMTGKVPHWSFLLVAGTFIAVFLIGWRVLVGVVGRRRAVSS